MRGARSRRESTKARDHAHETPGHEQAREDHDHGVHDRSRRNGASSAAKSASGKNPAG